MVKAKEEILSDDIAGSSQASGRSESVLELVYKLTAFYQKNPGYETSIIDIAVLMRLAHTEMDKFVRRSHTKVTKIYFDNDVPNAITIK